VGEDTAEDALGDEQLVVVSEAGDEPSPRLESAVAHGAELLEHLDHVEELLPVRAPELLERAPADAEALRERLELAPLAIAPRLGAPGAPVALDRREHGLGPLRPLTFQELWDGQPRELGGEMAQSAADALEVAARRLVALDLREGRLEGLDLRLQLADALEVLVLAERRLDPPPEGLGRRAGGEEERGGAVAELELALDRLGRAVHDAQEVLH